MRKLNVDLKQEICVIIQYKQFVFSILLTILMLAQQYYLLYCMDVKRGLLGKGRNTR